MPFDLRTYSFTDMLRASQELRRITRSAASMEEAGQAVVRYLYDRAVDPSTGERQCVLVRCYKTHPLGALEPALREVARGLLGDEPADPALKCLTLLATAGTLPAWNSRHQSRNHRAIPLASAQMVERAPMIAQLIRQFGLEIRDVVRPSPEVVPELEGKTYNVFHVPEALGSPFIPAQTDFVVPHRVRSVLGFGGSLRRGDLYAVVLFATVAIPRTSADRFRNIALDVKAGFFNFTDDQVFERGDS